MRFPLHGQTGITNIALRYEEKIHGFHQLTHSETGNDLVAEPSQYFSFSDHSVKVQNNEISLYLNGLCSGCGILPKKDYLTFCCFTGLAFSDVKDLSPEHLVKDNKGELWIRKNRQKTKIMCNIPVLPVAASILEKYKNVAECTGKLLPVLSNQRMNSYLKEIADVCGIHKNLSTHTARHSYATSICLANGVSMENVAKMLGHADTSVTKHYARVLDQNIFKDMQKVNSCLSELAI